MSSSTGINGEKMVFESFSLQTAGLVALLLVVTGVIVTWYFSRMEGSDEEVVLDVIQEKKKITREELQQMTGLSAEKLDKIIQSLEQVVIEDEEVHYVGERQKR